MNSIAAIKKIIEITPDNLSVLDIGAGKLKPHTTIFEENNYVVDTVDFFDDSTYQGDFNSVDIAKQYDIVWASHCLEHQLNVNNFLKKIHSVTKENGYAVITVPPMKHQIVGGHLSFWNAGLLIYNLVLAGFDCSDAKIKQYSYNISVIVQKKKCTIPYDKLVYDSGDLSTLNSFFPKKLNYKGITKKFNGNILEHNW